jgi:hypothetical protein
MATYTTYATESEIREHIKKTLDVDNKFVDYYLMPKFEGKRIRQSFLKKLGPQTLEAIISSPKYLNSLISGHKGRAKSLSRSPSRSKSRSPEKAISTVKARSPPKLTVTERRSLSPKPLLAAPSHRFASVAPPTTNPFPSKKPRFDVTVEHFPVSQTRRAVLRCEIVGGSRNRNRTRRS